ncbi:neither inactivation nor afterpotential protein G [Pectinophora gossypiella]|uniref:neither inactivation nor afterpotential protein G n=1 Tax=Pectinophora gossypiella TaxID=13191 RepID=UPI00214E4953|nr:neither inactivation nor afterpotential protein G [Pectinophora gossypiella]
MTVYSYIFGVIIAFVSYVVYQKYTNGYTSIIVQPHKRYDYVIVGAGTAGCVLAARLSENPRTKVLLLEAGDHMGYFTKIPLTPTAAQLGPNDWSVRTTPQKYSSFGLWDQTQILPRGKGLGGSGQINFLLHGLGLPRDYDNWVRRGFEGWTLKDLRPYFVKAFGSVRSEFDTKHCSLDGYCPGAKAVMNLKQDEENNELQKVFKEASRILSDKQTVFRKATATIKNGVRHVAFDAYLKPALNRKNLHVMLKTQAVSIRFENKTASSVYVLQNHRDLNNIFVDKEIILSAGSIKTPQLLMLSGIGPRELVNRLRIRLVADNKHVGRNLHDHMNIPVYVSIRRPISITLAKVFSFTTVWDYLWNSRGLFSFPPVAGVEFQDTSALMLFSMGTASERLLRDLSNYHPQVFRDTFPFHNDTSKEGFMFLATCLQPRSRGTVTLRDSSTSIPPVVDPNYLHHYSDVKCMVRAMRRAELMVATQPFKDIGARIHWPRPERCLSLWNYTKVDQTGIQPKRKRKLKQLHLDRPLREVKPKEKSSKPKSPPDEYLECLVREVAVTGHHAAGTCAGGSVVDDQLRVKSVSRVRIMDASVLPSPLSLYPNSVLIAMAERAADLIKHANIH